MQLPKRHLLAMPRNVEAWEEARANLVRLAARGDLYVISRRGRILDFVAVEQMGPDEISGCQIEVWSGCLEMRISGRHGAKA